MPCMSGRDFQIPHGTPSAGAGPPLRTPATRLSLFSLSSVSGKMDVTATPGIETPPCPFPGLFGTATAAKLVPSPLPLQPSRSPPQSQPQPQPSAQPQQPVQLESRPEQSQSQTKPQSQPEQEKQWQRQPQSEQQSQPQPEQQLKSHARAQLQPLPLDATPANTMVATTPVPSCPPTPSSALLADARMAAFQGACTPTGTHDAVAMAAASAAQSTFLAAYYSGNSQNMAPPASVPPTTLISALATPGPFPVLTSALPSTFDAAIMAPDDQDPTVELTGQGLEIPGPNAVATATASPPATATVMPTAPPPAAAVTHVVARDVPDGGMTAKARDVTVIAASDATAAGATTTPGANPVAPFVARLSSAGRRSSLPVGGISRRRTSVPTGMPFTVFSESMPPPQSRTPFSTTKKVPTCFGATLLRSPLGEIRVNAAATCPSPTVNIVSAKKTAGGGGSADGGFGSSGGGGCSMGSSDTSKDNEIVWDGKRPASAISAR